MLSLSLFSWNGNSGLSGIGPGGDFINNSLFSGGNSDFSISSEFFIIIIFLVFSCV